MREYRNLYLKLLGIIIGAPLVILAIYAWPFPYLRSVTSFGFVGGILGSGWLSFSLIKQAKGVTMAIVGTLIIMSAVLFCSLFLIANTLGE